MQRTMRESANAKQNAIMSKYTIRIYLVKRIRKILNHAEHEQEQSQRNENREQPRKQFTGFCGAVVLMPKNVSKLNK